MAILDFNGQPLDKLQYVGYSDIPSDANKAYQFPLGEDGGVSAKRGTYYDPADTWITDRSAWNIPPERANPIGAIVAASATSEKKGFSPLVAVLAVIVALVFFKVIK